MNNIGITLLLCLPVFALCLFAGYNAGKVSVYEQRSGMYKQVEPGTALPLADNPGFELGDE